MKQLVAIILLGTMAFACTSDKEMLQEEDLLGYWMLEEGYKDGKETSLLDKLYFEIKSGELHSNLFGSDQMYTYILDGNTLVSEGPQQLNYMVESVSDSNLVLNTTIRKHDFRFVLSRQKR